MQLDLVHEIEKSESGNKILQANKKELNGQCYRLLLYLEKGQKINMFNSCSIGVSVLHSRISDVRKHLKEKGIELKKERIKINNINCYNYYI